MRQILIAFFIIISISAVFGQQDERLKGLEKDLNKILEFTNAPSFAVAIVEGKEVVYAKGFGYKDYENKIPADANTLYAIGSCSKAFTSAVLGKLRARDKVSFEDSPIKYVPDLRFFNDDMNNKINIKDLMSHRTGLPRHDYSWYLFPSNSKDNLLQRIAYLEPFTGLREKWHYNNFGFLAQGVIAERITGKSWEENIQELFFDPLGMKRSKASLEEFKKSSNIAIGYEATDDVTSRLDYYDIAAMGPAGSIYSSVNEMTKWLITWINKGQYNGQEILSEEYVNEAISAQMIVNGALPSEEFPDMHLSTYGYAWFLSSYRGHYRVEHGGNIDGFSANVAFFPSDSIGIVVITNQDASSVPSLVRNTVADRMLKTEKTDWAELFNERKLKAKEQEAAAKAETVSSKTEYTKSPHPLEDYTGTYANPGYGSFRISNSNDSLFANFPLEKLYLKHMHYDFFEVFEVTETGIDAANTGGLQLNFTTNSSGEIASVKMKLEDALDHPIEFQRQQETIEMDKTSLERYVGNYELSGVSIKVKIKNETKLYLIVPGQPAYEMLPTDIHKFSIEGMDGYKVEFVESSDKSIGEMIITQPEGTFRATRK